MRHRGDVEIRGFILEAIKIHTLPTKIARAAHVEYRQLQQHLITLKERDLVFEVINPTAKQSKNIFSLTIKGRQILISWLKVKQELM